MLQQTMGEYPDQVHSDQMVLMTVRQEGEPRKRRSKGLKTKLAQGGPSGSSPLRLGGSRERWPQTLKGELEKNSRKHKDLVGKLA
jgi:hypothetical protein